MADISTPRCPVCGASAEGSGANGTSCPVCRAPYAFVSFFADPEDVKAWREKAEDYRAKVVERTCRKQLGRSCLSLGDRGAAVVTDRGQFLFAPHGDTELRLKDAVQVSFGSRHCLVLYRDGHVEAASTAYTRSDQGQYRVEDWSQVAFVEAGAGCSYGVRRDGSVLVSGIPSVPSEEVVGLTGVKAIAEGEGFVAVLTTAGQLRLLVSASSGDRLRQMQRAVSQCRNVTAIAAAWGCVLALDSGGRVQCFCADSDDARLGAGAWTDIVMVAVDSHYAAGLTAKGRLRLAGRESVRDSGRKEAAAWENNVALAGTRSGIGALALDGTLRLAGNIIGGSALREAALPCAQQIAAAVIEA